MAHLRTRGLLGPGHPEHPCHVARRADCTIQNSMRSGAPTGLRTRPLCETRQDAHPQPHFVVGPNGDIITLADLPSPHMTRWVIRRKAEIVLAVHGGLLSLDDACRRYQLTAEEFAAWQMPSSSTAFSACARRTCRTTGTATRARRIPGAFSDLSSEFRRPHRRLGVAFGILRRGSRTGDNDRRACHTDGAQAPPRRRTPQQCHRGVSSEA